jgi:hypothetical protein
MTEVTRESRRFSGEAPISPGRAPISALLEMRDCFSEKRGYSW